MRLPEIERGDGLKTRLLIRLISTMSGMRLPDAARVAFYHREFFSTPIGAWTHATMRGPSPWSIDERELMAAMVAKWIRVPFASALMERLRQRQWSGGSLTPWSPTTARRRSPKRSRQRSVSWRS